MRSAAVIGVLLVAGLGACHRPKHYDANVEVTRISPVRADENGRTLTVDIELSYYDCPGTQLEVIRGDATFAECIAKHKVGDRIPVAITRTWASQGVYTWNVDRIGDCTHLKDPSDEASYALVRECDDWTINGTRVGFQCRYLPEKHLIDKCPWFQRH
jgi:hypothetical protein